MKDNAWDTIPQSALFETYLIEVQDKSDELIVSAMTAAAAVCDSDIRRLQHEMMDFGIIVGCLVCVALPASGQVHAVKPAGRLMSWGVLGPVLLLGAFFAAEQGVALAVVRSMPWYDTNYQVSLRHLSAPATITLCASSPILDHAAVLILPVLCPAIPITFKAGLLYLRFAHCFRQTLLECSV